MQQITDVIASAQGGEAIPNLGRAFGLSTQQTEAVLAEVLPALVRGIERNTLSRGGLADLVKALGAGHHEAVLERPEAWGDRRVQQDGHGILGHILGSEGRARGLAVQTSRATGVSDSIIQMLLPILAQMLMGAISRWLKGGLGDIAGRLPGGDGGGGGMPFPMPGGGRSGGGREPNYGPGFELPNVDLPQQGGYPMPPLPGGGPSDGGGFGRGGTMEDLPRSPPPQPQQAPPGGFPMPWPQQGGGGGQQGGGMGLPLPLPQEAPQGGGGGVPMPSPQQGGGQGGGNNPYGDLSDILRRKGVANGVDGGGLWSVVRGMLGNGLGFQSKGVMGWIIKAVVLRYGWSILRRVLGRALTGR